MDFQVGGFLFGYPIIGYDGTTFTIRLPGSITSTVTPSALPSNAAILFELLGMYIPPQGGSGA